MALIVQKYGGTSVADSERIHNVAKRIKATRDEGHQVVVVVSARSGVTNALITRAKTLNPNPDEREMDLLLSVGEQETIALTTIALHALGVPAVSRTGAQVGIRTDYAHTRARILDIDGGDILDRIRENTVVIVAGFQGVSTEGQITTLGRGGSDLSALALAKVLQADLCQIYTDVEGVYSADPRIVHDAKKIDAICYEEMHELASVGFKVMQARAVEVARKYNIPFEVRSSFNKSSGTLVKSEIPGMEDVLVRGIAIAKDQVKITVKELPNTPGVAAFLFKALEDVTVDMIIQNTAAQGYANITFTVNKEDTQRAYHKVTQVLHSLGSGSVEITGEVAKISVVGVGMQTHSGVAARFFEALSQAGVNIDMITTSEIKISVAIDPNKADNALKAVHEAFYLNQPVLV